VTPNIARWRQPPPSILWAVCGLVLVGYVALGVGTTFRIDDWDLITKRSLGDPMSLLRPFNGHWLTVPAVIFRLLFQVFGTSSYVPYLIVLITLHGAMQSYFFA
jgi:hypothetical protein